MLWEQRIILYVWQKWKEPHVWAHFTTKGHRLFFITMILKLFNVPWTANTIIITNMKDEMPIIHCGDLLLTKPYRNHGK